MSLYVVYLKGLKDRDEDSATGVGDNGSSFEVGLLIVTRMSSVPLLSSMVSA